MSVPRKKHYPAPRSLIVLGKITNQEGKIRKAAGMSTTRRPRMSVVGAL
jgi:hypothetical protein